jgi:FkbM family methyltransferase
MIDRNRIYEIAQQIAKRAGLLRIPWLRKAGMRALQRYRSGSWLLSHEETVDIDGFQLAVLPRVLPGTFLSRGEIYEPILRDVMRQVLHAGDVAVDVGAHWGWHTTLMARLVGKAGTVVAFEPLELNRDLLIRNKEQNNLDWIIVRDRIVSPTSGESVILAYPESNLASATIMDSSRFVELDALGIDRVQFAKIDVEGAEAKVLQSMGRDLSRYENIYVELHHNYLTPSDYDVIKSLCVDRQTYTVSEGGLEAIHGSDELGHYGSLLSSIGTLQ